MINSGLQKLTFEKGDLTGFYRKSDTFSVRIFFFRSNFRSTSNCPKIAILIFDRKFRLKTVRSTINKFLNGYNLWIVGPSQTGIPFFQPFFTIMKIALIL